MKKSSYLTVGRFFGLPKLLKSLFYSDSFGEFLMISFTVIGMVMFIEKG
ncbi:TPA: hypothetical protein U1362_000421 [Streptococcus suis]|nr:hypothetical protein [Streptococcus suis]HEM5285239.1 hypothetical protein [Streptococcus suis]HEP1784548.1 hypothetical protein [Streptococcus suis]